MKSMREIRPLMSKRRLGAEYALRMRSRFSEKVKPEKGYRRNQQPLDEEEEMSKYELTDQEYNISNLDRVIDKVKEINELHESIRAGWKISMGSDKEIAQWLRLILKEGFRHEYLRMNCNLDFEGTHVLRVMFGKEGEMRIVKALKGIY